MDPDFEPEPVVEGPTVQVKSPRFSPVVSPACFTIISHHRSVHPSVRPLDPSIHPWIQPVKPFCPGDMRNEESLPSQP